MKINRVMVNGAIHRVSTSEASVAGPAGALVATVQGLSDLRISSECKLRPAILKPASLMRSPAFCRGTRWTFLQRGVPPSASDGHLHDGRRLPDGNLHRQPIWSGHHQSAAQSAVVRLRCRGNAKSLRPECPLQARAGWDRPDHRDRRCLWLEHDRGRRQPVLVIERTTRAHIRRISQSSLPTAPRPVRAPTGA